MRSLPGGSKTSVAEKRSGFSMSLPRVARRGCADLLSRVLEALLGSRMRRTLNHSQVDRILILQLQQLGDSVVFTPTLRALRQRFPTSRITILANAVSFQVYRKSSHVDDIELMPAPTSHPWSWLEMFWRLHRQRFDLAIADVTQVSLKYGI